MKASDARKLVRDAKVRLNKQHFDTHMMNIKNVSNNGKFKYAEQKIFIGDVKILTDLGYKVYPLTFDPLNVENNLNIRPENMNRYMVIDWSEEERERS